MLQMIRFGTILGHFGPKVAQIFQMVSFGTFLDHFGPKATQMFQMVSFGTILGYFGPEAAQPRCQPDARIDKFCYNFEPFPFGQLSLATFGLGFPP